MVSNEFQILKDMHKNISYLYKYYSLITNNKIDIDTFQKNMNIFCEDIIKQCTLLKELQNQSSQLDALLAENQQLKEKLRSYEK